MKLRARDGLVGGYAGAHAAGWHGTGTCGAFGAAEALAASWA